MEMTVEIKLFRMFSVTNEFECMFHLKKKKIGRYEFN